MTYHDDLKEIKNSVLLQLLLQVDPTPNSLQQSGAVDWADIKERMHFIAELFRCFHPVKEIFTGAFTKEQIIAMREGRLPDGRL